jgi:glutamyl-tRNA synthetase
MSPPHPSADSSIGVTRLAPSPTGALHLGNARTFLVNWAMAVQRGWRVVMRVEDLDTPRVKPGAEAAALDDLAWLGLTWEGMHDPGRGVLRQRDDLSPYRRALMQLHGRGLIYPCSLTRSEIAEAVASAPQRGDAAEHDLRYPGTSRDADASDVSDLLSPSDRCWRLRVPAGPRVIEDGVMGPVTVDVQAEVGDFIVASKAGLPAYQLAVVVDDHRQGVTDVVRGDDLIGSAARQAMLWAMLGLDAGAGGAGGDGQGGAGPRWWHVPLVLGADGHRLAKRHGDTRLRWFAEQGVTAERMVGLLAWWSGVRDDGQAEPVAMSARAFAEAFTLDALPREPVVMDDRAWRWLLPGGKRGEA